MHLACEILLLLEVWTNGHSSLFLKLQMDVQDLPQDVQAPDIFRRT